jgi:PadR family transcriptional regulator, regulatory protein PadR
MAKHPNDRLQGTLDLLVLKTLASRGPMHGYGITLHIGKISEESLRVEEGSLYPALHRMTQAGWIKAEWGAHSRQHHGGNDAGGSGA